MQREFDLIVIGAGGAGGSVALEAARRGKRVLVLERFQIGHDHGSSHGHSRIFRFAYDEAELNAASKNRIRKSFSNDGA